MEKQELTAWEQRCIQDEAPACTSACPIHVDVRQFVQQIGQENWKGALDTLARTMPFPRILAHICDHPCEEHCKRRQAGGAIAIGALERACIQHAQNWRPKAVMAQKRAHVAVVGSSLSSLTAAWDLLTKGYAVTIIEPQQRLGGRLWELPEELLPRAILDQDLQALNALRATVELAAKCDGERCLERLQAEFDAVYIGFDHDLGKAFPELRDDSGRFISNLPLMTTVCQNVFAGGIAPDGEACSNIMQVLDGRRGATSIDRYLAKVALTYGRDGEGPHDTRLFTNLTGIEAQAPLLSSDETEPATDDDAVKEARRCIQCECLECVKVCDYLRQAKSYPKKYARQIYNNERVIFGSAHTKNQFVNSCSLCGLCAAVCPTNFSMGELSLQARRTMVEQNSMPASFHEFALQDMAFSNSDKFALCRHQPRHNSSRYLYFPSCQLCSTCPGEVLDSYAYLCDHLTGGVGIWLGCCGAPALWAGQEELFKQALTAMRDQWCEMGLPKIIVACSSCQQLLEKHLPDIETISLWSLVDTDTLASRGQTTNHTATPRTLAIVDPCSSRHNHAGQQTVRKLVRDLGFRIEELPLHGEEAECCGYGGLMFNTNPRLAREIVNRRAQDSPCDYLAYCGMCRDNFAATGKRTAHLIELLFSGPGKGDPAARGWISWSERRANRSKIKTHLLQTRWNENATRTDSENKMILHMSPEIQRRIDERRILEDDIQRVIAHAEKTGQRLIDKRNGNFRACQALENVTFWVEYAPEDQGFTVYNAYSHRMKIKGVKHDTA
ncbi:MULTISPECIES: pyridine nucleotide-disulfide oxidoreductase/dicluster-binding protein [Syntrophotalea]|jgi:Fe-S oxidoreductase|uniref:Amine oxidase n=1 Tax=Syntrophotalea acetylenica TaxID=29542 RepID=A0A1L3GF51_SYNAC|nr:pyridine nucleotide-disulfide oxidoreductase/dicluster-binding protein [Syntrophotalea acetylenica]APG24594.1 amine oxidase [Syntrophotalea acetylenica]APG45177.1 amine oxidase [Syntrophotalea acetylenica]MDY0263174.1 4Fe-4S dicluster domain-containing protein [Syntrophotalea acetylenica]